MQHRKVSKTRVLVAISMILLLVFCLAPFLVYPPEYAPYSLRVVATAYVSLQMLILGLVGLVLYYKFGEPVLELSVGLILTPAFFLMYLCAGDFRWHRFAPFFVQTLFLVPVAITALKRSKEIGTTV